MIRQPKVDEPLVLIGGYLTSPLDYRDLAAALAGPGYGYRVFVAPIGRIRWAITRDWDLRALVNIIRSTVEQARAATGAERVTILAHSVGGTLARIYIGDQPYVGTVYGGFRYVKRLVMLGTPHHSQESWTRQSVSFVNEAYPGAFYDEIAYVSVVGRSVWGDPTGTRLQRWASSTYATVAGPGHAQTWGDGITPLHGAVLPGAEFLVVDGVTHSPFHGQPWYGDPASLPHWERVIVPPALRATALSSCP